MQRRLLALVIGLGIGTLGGVLLGWFAPVQDTSMGFDRLHPDYMADYAVMVGASYALNGDWDLAQARLGRLAQPDPAAYVARIAEQYIAEGRSPGDIRSLVRLATRLGYITPLMQPYVLPSDPQP